MYILKILLTIPIIVINYYIKSKLKLPFIFYIFLYTKLLHSKKIKESF